MHVASSRRNSCCTLAAIGEAGIPSEVRYKSGYINPVPRPKEFRSAMLRGMLLQILASLGTRRHRLKFGRCSFPVE